MSSAISGTLAQEPWKQAVLAIGLLVYITGGVMMVIVMINRTWKPFKAKQLDTCCALYLAGFLYFLSNLVEYEIVDQTGGFSNCSWWLLWSQIVFGVGLSLFILCYRMYRLYFLIILRKSAEGLQFWWPLVISYLPVWLLCLVSAAMPDVMITSQPVLAPNSTVPGCNIKSQPFNYIIYLCLLIQFVFLWVLAYRVSKLRKSFNEYKENIAIASVTTANMVLTLVMNLSLLSYTVGGKIVCVFVSVICGNLVYGMPLIKPFYGFLTDPKKTMADFITGMQDEAISGGGTASHGGTSTVGGGAKSAAVNTAGKKVAGASAHVINTSALALGSQELKSPK